MPLKSFNVIIIGGSGAGLSAALVLGRSGSQTLVLDNGRPCNGVAPKSHNFLTHDAQAPSAIRAAALKDLQSYETVTFKPATVVKVQKLETGFEVETKTAETFKAQKLIFANGVTDELPDIKGFKACWGISALHCAYCHGYEFKNEPTGFIFDGTSFLDTASVLYNLSTNLVVLTNGILTLSARQLKILGRHNIEIIYTKIKEIVHDQGQVKQVLFTDGTTKDFKVLYVHTKRNYNSDLAASVGCELGESGYVKRNGDYKTNVPGVFACGDVSGAARSVAVAVASGNLAGMAANTELCSEGFFND